MWHRPWCSQQMQKGSSDSFALVLAAALHALCTGHIMQFLPRLGWALLKKIGPSRARAVKEGRSGYDYKVVKNM